MCLQTRATYVGIDKVECLTAHHTGDLIFIIKLCDNLIN